MICLCSGHVTQLAQLSHCENGFQVLKVVRQLSGCRGCRTMHACVCVCVYKANQLQAGFHVAAQQRLLRLQSADHHWEAAAASQPVS